MKNTHHLVWITLSNLLFMGLGCGGTPVQPDSPYEPPEVHVAGALYKIMHENRTESRVALNQLVDKDDLFGLGALENLLGEVTIYNGQIWLARPDNQGQATSENTPKPTAGATLLVTSTVKAWQRIPIANAVSFDQLDDWLEREARKHGIDVNQAFPFLIEGVLPHVDWHVIDGRKIPEGVHGHEAHIKTAIRGTLAIEQVKVIGFFSKKHHRIFTHHDTNTHAHVIAPTAQVSGHIDAMTIAPGATLILPKTEQTTGPKSTNHSNNSSQKHYTGWTALVRSLPTLKPAFEGE